MICSPKTASPVTGHTTRDRTTDRHPYQIIVTNHLLPLFIFCTESRSNEVNLLPSELPSHQPWPDTSAPNLEATFFLPTLIPALSNDLLPTVCQRPSPPLVSLPVNLLLPYSHAHQFICDGVKAMICKKQTAKKRLMKKKHIYGKSAMVCCFLCLFEPLRRGDRDTAVGASVLRKTVCSFVI